MPIGRNVGAVPGILGRNLPFAKRTRQSLGQASGDFDWGFGPQESMQNLSPMSQGIAYGRTRPRQDTAGGYTKPLGQGSGDFDWGYGGPVQNQAAVPTVDYSPFPTPMRHAAGLYGQQPTGQPPTGQSQQPQWAPGQPYEGPVRQSPYSSVDQHGGTNGFPYPRNEMHRQALLAQWNTRNRGVPAPDFLRTPMGQDVNGLQQRGGFMTLEQRKPDRPLTPTEQAQLDYDQQAVHRTGPDPWGRPRNDIGFTPLSGQPGPSSPWPDPYAAQALQTLQQGGQLESPEAFIGRFRDQLQQRLAASRSVGGGEGGEGGGVFHPQNSGIAAQLASGGHLTDDQAFRQGAGIGGEYTGTVVGGQYGNNQALRSGQARVHPMVPGGAGLTEITPPWHRTRKWQAMQEPIDLDRVAAARAKMPGMDRAQIDAQEKRDQLAYYKEQKARALERRAAPLRARLGDRANEMSDQDVIDTAAGRMTRGERQQLVTANAVQRAKERRDRIANRNAVPSIEQRMMMQNPVLGVQALRNQGFLGAADLNAQAALDQQRLANQGDLDVARIQQQQQQIPMQVQFDRFVEGARAAGITDFNQILEQWQQRNAALNGPPAAGTQGPGLPQFQGGGARREIPVREQSSLYGPQVTASDEAQLEQDVARFGDRETQEKAIREFGQRRGWSEEQIASAISSRLGRTWMEWESSQPVPGQFVGGSIGGGLGSAIGSTLDYFGLNPVEGLRRFREAVYENQRRRKQGTR